MVQSARVQEIVKGDDVVLQHQIMASVAYEAEVGRAPVLVNANDLVDFFYPLQDGTNDLVGYRGTPVGAYPASVFSVACPGTIVPADPLLPNRGTSTWQSGAGRTVRAEISRLKANPTANTATGSAVLSNVSNFSNIAVGQRVSGVGIPNGSLVESFDSIAQTVTLTQNATATASGVSVTFTTKETHYNIDEVDVFERGFPASLEDTSGGVNPPAPTLNLP